MLHLLIQDLWDSPINLYGAGGLGWGGVFSFCGVRQGGKKYSVIQHAIVAPLDLNTHNTI